MPLNQRFRSGPAWILILGSWIRICVNENWEVGIGSASKLNVASKSASKCKVGSESASKPLSLNYWSTVLIFVLWTACAGRDRYRSTVPIMIKIPKLFFIVVCMYIGISLLFVCSEGFLTNVQSRKCCYFLAPCLNSVILQNQTINF